MMASTAHTPGPWAVEDPLDFELAIVEAGKASHEWRIIAGCPLPDGDGGFGDGSFSKKQVHANARLIAAAPELLAALADLNCSEILGVAESCASGMPRWEFVHKRIEAARSAIAKARGAV